MYLLDRYLEQTATEEELQEYADWYRKAGSAGPNLFDHAHSPAAQEYTGSLFASISTHIDAAEQRQAKGRQRVLYFRWAAAAAVIVLAGSLALYNGLRTKPAPAPFIAVKPSSPAPPANTIRIATQATEKRRIDLPDGSVAELFENSELNYEAPFGSHSRHIYLKGKGYFTVVKDGARPFTVYSEGFSTTALGTSFTITAYPGKNAVQVLLHSGKVVVKQWPHHDAAPMQDVYLLPGQQATCHSSTGLATVRLPAEVKRKRPVPPGSRTGFAAAFDQAPVTAVLDTIEKGYSVHLRYDKMEMADMVFSGRIRETDSLSQVLYRISALYNLTIQPTVKEYIIRKNH